MRAAHKDLVMLLKVAGGADMAKHGDGMEILDGKESVPVAELYN